MLSKQNNFKIIRLNEKKNILIVILKFLIIKYYIWYFDIL
jgi:hypothetical protein